MAILLEGSDGAPVMWGRIGEFLVQRTKSGKMYLKKYSPPANPRSPAQQRNRTAFREGLSRWRNLESLSRKDYWTDIAKSYGFRDGYRAFLSSFMALYHRKLQELASDEAALALVRDPGLILYYEASASHIQAQQKNEELITAVFEYRKSKDFLETLQSTIRYMKETSYSLKIRYGLLPRLDGFAVTECERLGILKL
ncbi:MAG: hypothetical protein OEZ36_13260 [Spirochaetota bacterium]|nr:hypothetical protein [Spirochaetota bacterium]